VVTTKRDIAIGDDRATHLASTQSAY